MFENSLALNGDTINIPSYALFIVIPSSYAGVTACLLNICKYWNTLNLCRANYLS